MISSRGYLHYLILLTLSSSIASFHLLSSTTNERNILSSLSSNIHTGSKTNTVPLCANNNDFIDGVATPTTRSVFLQKSLLAASSALCASSSLSASAAALDPKQTNLSPDEIAAIVESDMVERSFLATGDLTRSIYSESAMFTDEIDTYTLEKWTTATPKLFVGPPSSNVKIVGKIEASEREVSFRFEEDLMFRIPLRPVVYLSGKVVLEREADTGLIKSYREIWDQDVGTVLRSAKFNFSS